MCFDIKRYEVSLYGNQHACLMPLTPHALFKLTQFVVRLDNHDGTGNKRYWLTQRMEGKIIGALGYAAILVASIVECLVFLVLDLLALLPAAALSLCCGDLVSPITESMKFTAKALIDTPVRSLSGLVQNILLGQRKNYRELHLLSICKTSIAVRKEY